MVENQSCVKVYLLLNKVTWLLQLNIYCACLICGFKAISSYSNFKASKLFTSQVDTGEQEFYAWACEQRSFFRYTSSGAKRAPDMVSAVQVLSVGIWCSADVRCHTNEASSSSDRTRYARDYKVSVVTLRPIVGPEFNHSSRHTKTACLTLNLCDLACKNIV